MISATEMSEAAMLKLLFVDSVFEFLYVFIAVNSHVLKKQW